jgi:tetratricopeptide (TPR) repeat protein
MMDRTSTSDGRKNEPMPPQPFFMMDWFEDLLQDHDTEKLAALLKTPSKQWRPSRSDRLRAESKTDAEQGDDATYCPTPKSSNCHKRFPPKPPGAEKNNLAPRNLFGTKQTKTVHSTIAFGDAYNAKGLKKAQDGKWAGALACWDKATEIRYELSKDSLHLKADLANVLNNRGIALGKLGHHKEACDSLNTALQIYENLNSENNLKERDIDNDIIIANTLHNLANAHHQAGNFSMALQIFTKAKSLARENLQLARICTAMGHVYLEACQWQDAKDAYQDALKVCDEQDEVQKIIYDIEELDRHIIKECK